MSTHPFIHGIDFCFNAAEPGTQAPDGHYDLGFGFIQRGSEKETWQKENEGDYQMTVGMRITDATGNQVEFGCTAGIQVRDD